MNIYRRFIFTFIVSQILFIVINAVIWGLYTSPILTDDYESKVGDLSRVGYVLSAAWRKRTVIDLPVKHMEGYRFKGGDVDMITIGDSFSMGACSGKNPFYQDYIASKHGLRIVNLTPFYPDSFMETIVLLANGGYFEKHRVRYVLIESIERFCIERFARDIDFDAVFDIKKMEEYYMSYEYKSWIPEKVDFINDGNLTWLLYSLFYRYSDHAFFSQTYIMDTKSNYFSHGDRNKLLFYDEDLKYAVLVNSASVSKLNQNLNKLNKLLERHNVKLYFMPAPDKYDMYSDYLVSNPYPRSVFFEKLRDLPKDYYFVDTKAILRRELEKGALDIYYNDDTHWTWKASKAITDTIKLGAADDAAK